MWVALAVVALNGDEHDLNNGLMRISLKVYLYSIHTYPHTVYAKQKIFAS